MCECGIETCAKLKAMPATRAIPILITTALSGEADKVAAIQAGADDFVPKPMDTLMMLQRIKTLIRLKLMQDRLDALPSVLTAQVGAQQAATILQALPPLD
jgi:two-component system, cell cycle response regulator